MTPPSRGLLRAAALVALAAGLGGVLWRSALVPAPVAQTPRTVPQVMRPSAAAPPTASSPRASTVLDIPSAAWTRNDDTPAPSRAPGASSPTPLSPRLTQWLDAPDSSLRTAEVAALLEALAAHDPAAALALAGREPAADTSQVFMLAALRGWATHDAPAAAHWALTLAPAPTAPGVDRALAAVFRGAATEPTAALALAEQLQQAAPASAAAIGTSLLFALGAADAHPLAAEFSLRAAPAMAADRITGAYAAWARADPEPALLSALAVPDPGRRRLAVQAALSAWAQLDPETMAEQVLAFPEGEERTFALAVTSHLLAERP